MDSWFYNIEYENRCANFVNQNHWNYQYIEQKKAPSAAPLVTGFDFLYVFGDKKGTF